ncbi:coproporphyrinogen III oxidase family protein, partial [bacterium]
MVSTGSSDGVPPLLPVDTMRRLLEGLHERLDLSELNEWTVEVNPATADAAFLATLRSHGVDRISLGAQSFIPSELATLERHHDPDDVERSIAMARDAGFERLNIDLIYAIPGQTLDTWQRSLDRAAALKIEHYACYNLTYEPNTPMAVKQRLGRLEVIEESIELQMLQRARAFMAGIGRRPYEVSNYGTPCRHNLNYWTGGDYLGIGPSAASHVRGTRFKNRPHLGEWERAINECTLPAIDVEYLSQDDREGEAMMLGLRLAEGVEWGAFVQRFGRSIDERFPETLAQMSRVGLVEATPTHVRLTPAGLPIADAIAAEFLAGR